MRTNIDIDDALMAEAMKVTGQKTKKATVEEALKFVLMFRSTPPHEGRLRIVVKYWFSVMVSIHAPA